jgi:hypothetical protein
MSRKRTRSILARGVSSSLAPGGLGCQRVEASLDAPFLPASDTDHPLVCAECGRTPREGEDADDKRCAYSHEVRPRGLWHN